MSVLGYHFQGKRRPLRRWLMSLGVLICILALAFPSMRNNVSQRLARAELQYWQRRCMTWSAPPGTIAYDDSEASDPRQVGGSEYQRSNLEPRTVMLMPHCLREYAVRSRCLPTSWLDEAGALFVGGLSSPNGQRYLVVVRFVPGFRQPRHPLAGIRVDTLRAFRLTDSQAAPPRVFRGGGIYSGSPSPPIVLMVGQPDPHDPCRVTIEYRLDGARGSIDGRLNDAGEVTLSDHPPERRLANRERPN
jgi:hypothetical protein